MGMSIKKWSGLDSAFALGFCSRCPGEEYLVELLTDSELKFEPNTVAAILSLIQRMELHYRDFESQQAQDQSTYARAQTYSPDRMHVWELSKLADASFKAESEIHHQMSYKIGVTLGQLSFAYICRREPPAEEYDSAQRVLSSLPAAFSSLAVDLRSFVSKCRTSSLAVTFDQMIPGDCAKVPTS